VFASIDPTFGNFFANASPTGVGHRHEPVFSASITAATRGELQRTSAIPPSDENNRDTSTKMKQVALCLFEDISH
jgi:hypothetical protein